MDKKLVRLKRARKSRAKIRQLAVHRLTVHRTPKHIYVQIISPNGHDVVACASTLQEDVKKLLLDSESCSPGNQTAASIVGKTIAERAQSKGVERVAFDRSGFKYHGRIKALADAAREHGLKF